MFSWPSPSSPSKFLLLSPARLTPEHRRLEVAQMWDAEEEQVKRSVFPPPVEDLGGRTVRVTGFQVEIHLNLNLYLNKGAVVILLFFAVCAPGLREDTR